MNHVKKAILAVVTSAVMLISLTPAVFPTVNAETGRDTASDIPEQPSVSELTKGKEYSDDKVLVLFDDSMSKSEVKQETKEEGYSAEQVATQLDGSKLATVSTDNVKEALKDMQSADGAVYVQPSYTYKVKDTAIDPYCSQKSGECWQLGNVYAENAWAYMKSKGFTSKVKVCVIDTGCQTNHEDLAIDTKLSKTFLNGRSYTFKGEANKTSSHGTHVSGIINMTYNNHLGGAGIAAGTDNNIVDLFVCGTSSDGENMEDPDIVNALNYAAKEGAQVVNLSLGGYVTDVALNNAIKQGYSKHDIVYCAANGNDGDSTRNTPADLGCVLAVGSTTINNKHSDFSNYNKYIDIAAPGSDVLSTVQYNPKDENLTNMDKYAAGEGTSMATPCVTAVCALVRSANPSLKNYQVMDIVQSSATDLGKKGWDVYFGSGLVNAYRAVRYAYVKPVTNVKLSLTAYNAINVSWTGNSEATSYSVQYRTYGGQFRSVDSGVPQGTTSCTAKKLAQGTRYQFRVIARDNNGKSAPVYSPWMYTLKKGSVTSVRKYSSKIVNVSWAQVAQATQYEVSVYKARATTGNLYKKITVNSTTRSAHIRVNRNVKYYYRVRAVRKTGGKAIYAPISDPRAFRLR